jgi:YidC/Oxa1 family membrane protein insertase
VPVHLFGITIDLSLLLIPSPPGWHAYVSFLEHVLDALATTFHSAGLAVVIFTIIVKTLLLPLTIKSIRSSKAMQELQPKIKELQKKYGKDRQRISQETMRLYAQYGVNPMSGCLPMVLQIPVFWGVYRAIYHLSAGSGIPDASAFWGHGFLWMGDLAQPDPYKILPILAGVFQFIQTKMMRPHGQEAVTDPQQKMMNQMMNFMPFMVVLFGWNFASGPVIYWVTQSVYSVVQQWFITGWGSLHDWIPGLPELPEHRRLGYRPPKPVEDVVVLSGEEGGPVRHSGVMGWIQQRMEQAEHTAEARRATAQTTKGGKATARAVPEPEPDGEAEDEAPPARPTKTTSYQSRVDAARNKPARLTKAGGSGGYQEQVDAATVGEGPPPARATRRKKPAPANGKPAGAGNGAQGPVVPRKSRPGRKSE